MLQKLKGVEKEKIHVYNQSTVKTKEKGWRKKSYMHCKLTVVFYYKCVLLILYMSTVLSWQGAGLLNEWLVRVSYTCLQSYSIIVPYCCYVAVTLHYTA